MKPCIKCLRNQPLTEFYPHSRMADGHLNKCKECTRSDVKANRSANIEYVLQYDRNRPNKLERAKQVAQYRATSIGKSVIQAANKTYHEKYPLKRKAHHAVDAALRDSILTRPTTCETCCVQCFPHAHHCDYSKPLDVMWLCQPCHVKWHKENKAVYL